MKQIRKISNLVAEELQNKMDEMGIVLEERTFEEAVSAIVKKIQKNISEAPIGGEVADISWEAEFKTVINSVLGVSPAAAGDITNSVEEVSTDIQNVAILIDCSPSMGAMSFRHAIVAMVKAFNEAGINKTKFHILGFGSLDAEQVKNTYKAVVGVQAFETSIKMFKSEDWVSAFVPAVEFLMGSGKKYDAIFVLTDGELVDVSGTETEAVRYVRRFHKRIVWVVPKGIYNKNGIKRFDMSALSDNRVALFKHS